jgi:putative SOS response-associated peptidase YedK
MPVILQQTDFDLWLDNTMNDPLKLQRLYQPYPAELMTSWPVSSFVNSPRNDSPACIEPVTA